MNTILLEDSVCNLRQKHSALQRSMEQVYVPCPFLSTAFRGARGDKSVLRQVLFSLSIYCQSSLHEKNKKIKEKFSGGWRRLCAHEVNYTSRKKKAFSAGNCLQQLCNSSTQWLIGQVTPFAVPIGQYQFVIFFHIFKD